MSDKKIIFLSYHREDSLGYVTKLQKDLQRYFGKDYVVRDIEKSQQDLMETLDNAAIVLAIIGPRWEEICNELKNNPDKHLNDKVRNELVSAKQQGVTVLPITLNGMKLSGSTDMGSLNWLLKQQQYDLTDDEDRWAIDVFGLVNKLECIKGLDRVKHEKINKEGKPLSNKVLVVAMLLAIIIAFSFRKDLNTSGDSIEASQQDQIGAISVTNIGGKWKSAGGFSFTFGKPKGGRFMVASYGFGRGTGSFSKTVPGKFYINLMGAGHGEYSVSSAGDRIEGWFLPKGESDKQHAVFNRIE